MSPGHETSRGPLIKILALPGPVLLVIMRGFLDALLPELEALI